MAKRLVFIDVAKGCAILGVILVHALIVGVWFVPANAIKVLPTYALAILSPLVIISTWAGFFELMSGLANSYNLYDKLVVKEMSFKKASQGALVNSTGLLLVHFIFIFFLSHRRNPPYPAVGTGASSTGEIHTLITGSFETGRLYLTDYQYYFFASVLGSIALAGYFSILTFYVVYKTIGLEKINRVVILLTGIMVAFFTISYPVWDAGYSFLNFALNEGGFWLVLAFPLAPFTGAFQPFFPIAGFSILGACIGLLLSVRSHKVENPEFYVDEKNMDVHQYINRVSAIAFVAFIALLIHALMTLDDPLSLLNFYRLPPTLLALNVSLMVLVFKAGIKIFEDPDEEVRSRRAEKSLWIRKFGMITLTVYVLESPVNGILAFFYHRMVDNPATDVMESQVLFLPIILYTVFVIGFWFFIVGVWEKLDFKYTIEYWVIRFGQRFRETKSMKLDITKVLYDPLGRLKKKPTLVTPINPPIQK